MARQVLLECTFLIPVRGDEGLSDGEPHSSRAWDWLKDQLWQNFRGGTRDLGLYEGFYEDPQTGRQVTDLSRKYTVALPISKLRALRRMLKEACLVFSQQCIYLSIAGKVEFIDRPLN